MISKAPCRVILTAPPADWQAKFARDHAEQSSASSGRTRGPPAASEADIAERPPALPNHSGGAP